MSLLQSTRSIIEAGIYWLIENATTYVLANFKIGLYNIIVPQLLSISFISKYFLIFLGNL